MPPSEVGKRFSAKEVGQIIAFEAIQDEMAKERQREAELEIKAARAKGNL